MGFELLLTFYGLIWLFTHFEPLQEYIDIIFMGLAERFADARFWMILDYVYTALQCQRCLTLWIGMFIGIPFFTLLPLVMIASIHQRIDP
jgi:hypothetical protein